MLISLVTLLVFDCLGLQSAPYEDLSLNGDFGKYLS